MNRNQCTFNKDYQYKYLHIFPQGSIVYDSAIIFMVNTDNRFNEKDHLFLVFDRDVYNHCCGFHNVKFVDDLISSNFSLFKTYIKLSRFVFLHSNTLKLSDAYRLSKSNLNKIVWCEWGHDLYRGFNKGGKSNSFKEKVILSLKEVYLFFYDIQIKKIKAIGLGFKYDSLEIKSRFGEEMKILQTPYFSKDLNLKIIEEMKNSNIAEKKQIKIMVGHSAYPFLNHKEILKKIVTYENENIIVSLVLSYGDNNYRDEVISYGKELFGNKIEIIDKKMSTKEYISFLNTVDIAVFDQIHQSALSNIYYLLYFEKKLVLNKRGIIARALEFENISFSTTDELGIVPLSDIISNSTSNHTRSFKFALEHLDTEVLYDKWWNTINWLDSY